MEKIIIPTLTIYAGYILTYATTLYALSKKIEEHYAVKGYIQKQEVDNIDNTESAVGIGLDLLIPPLGICKLLLFNLMLNFEMKTNNENIEDSGLYTCQYVISEFRKKETNEGYECIFDKSDEQLARAILLAHNELADYSSVKDLKKIRFLIRKYLKHIQAEDKNNTAPKYLKRT